MLSVVFEWFGDLTFDATKRPLQSLPRNIRAQIGEVEKGPAEGARLQGRASPPRLCRVPAEHLAVGAIGA